MDAKNKKKDIKTKLYQIRLTEEEANLLETLSVETVTTRADIFRKALKLYATVKRNNIGDSFLG